MARPLSAAELSMHLVITDSGMGGLSVCAELERRLRLQALTARLTYVNAWPQHGVGYNDLPDMAARARVFDRALVAMTALRPDGIVIACNTLSVVYEATAFGVSPLVPVVGIVEAGVNLFREALAADEGSAIVLFGTRTTIESGVHRDRLIAGGIAAGRIVAVPCHGLAAAIEADPDGRAAADLIDTCTARAVLTVPAAERLYLGLCCTHYTYVAGEMRAALERRCRCPVRTLDPSERLVGDVLERTALVRAEGGIDVKLLSKVQLDDGRRRAMAARIERVSPATAAALLSYTHDPVLF